MAMSAIQKEAEIMMTTMINDNDNEDDYDGSACDQHGSACKDRRPQLFFPSPTSQIGPAHPRQRGYTRPGVSFRDNQARLL